MIKIIDTGDYDLELLSAYGQTLDLEEMILYIDFNYDDFLDWKRAHGKSVRHTEWSKSEEVLDEIKDCYEKENKEFSLGLGPVLFDTEPDEEEEVDGQINFLSLMPKIPRTEEDFLEFCIDYVLLYYDDLEEKYRMTSDELDSWYVICTQKLLDEESENFSLDEEDFYD